MKRNALFIMMVFVLCTSIMGARAQSLGVKAGILGIGIEGKVGLTRHLGLRAGVNYFPLKIDASNQTIKNKLSDAYTNTALALAKQDSERVQLLKKAVELNPNNMKAKKALR